MNIQSLIPLSVDVNKKALYLSQYDSSLETNMIFFEQQTQIN